MADPSSEDHSQPPGDPAAATLSGVSFATGDARAGTVMAMMVAWVRDFAFYKRQEPMQQQRS